MGRPPIQFPGLLARIGYDTDLESRAFALLERSDAAGCRKALGQLVSGLSPQADRHRVEVTHLLLDVLQNVNRTVHAGPERGAERESNRLELIVRFGEVRDLGQLREAFLPALNSLLAPMLAGGSAFVPLVQRAKSCIERRYHRRLSLSDVARHLNVSPNYLSRRFKRETGMTLTEYVQRVRLRSARVMLAQGGCSISEIAYRVGYQNYRDFHRNFVKYEEHSPRQARRAAPSVADARLLSE
ncbi:MAG: helix-turn-helix transcriptional regulator [bacterium]|nr:helix-turn-helix transcriptional regulator [bacterium]